MENKADNSPAIELLKQLTEQMVGHTLSSPTDFDELCSRISAATGANLSISSVKRLWGYVRYDNTPKESTLSVLARFVGFSDWTTFKGLVKDGMPSETSAFLSANILQTASLAVGDSIILTWAPAKGMTIECCGRQRFVVREAHNIKLHEGDTLTVYMFCPGQPFYATNIIRGDISVPGYVGAKQGGVTTCRVIEG